MANFGNSVCRYRLKKKLLLVSLLSFWDAHIVCNTHLYEDVTVVYSIAPTVHQALSELQFRFTENLY